MPESLTWQPQSQLITADELPGLFAQHPIVVIHCGAVWDKHDAVLDATVQEIKPLFEEQIAFYAVDIDNSANHAFCREQGLANVPTLFCFMNGRLKDMAVGAYGTPELLVWLRHWVLIAESGHTTTKGQQAWSLSLQPPCYYACLQRFGSGGAGVWHGVTLRMPDDDENNQSFTITQDWEQVRRNRDYACRKLFFTPAQLVMPAQIHGANVAVVGAEDAGRGALSPDTAVPDCDALVTKTLGLLLGITIADCLPVFFLDPVHKAIGLAHSGWRGTAGRIAVRTLETMTAHFGTRPEDCQIALGPGIGPDGYEVDQRVFDGFSDEDANAPGVFTPTRPGHWQLDLYAAVCHQLQRAGILASNVDVCQYRTNRHTDLFFSHRLVPGCGRMGAFIGIKR